jgi:hypothetical protein
MNIYEYEALANFVWDHNTGQYSFGVADDYDTLDDSYMQMAAIQEDPSFGDE